MLKIFKIFISFFKSIDIYHHRVSKKIKIEKGYKLHYFKSFKAISSKSIKNYFLGNFKNKIRRFKNNQFFLVLTYKKKLVSSGWIYSGKKWFISEIQKTIDINHCNVIFDFITESEERNKGNYLRILYLISKKFRNKTLMIYSQSNNYFSKKAIVKAGFVFKKRL